jgi:hypothetical protein
MLSYLKPRHVPRRARNGATCSGILESLIPRSQIDKDRQFEKQLKPVHRRSDTACCNVPTDLDRIEQASTAPEILEIVNQIVQLLHRTGRLEEVPPHLLAHAFQSNCGLDEVLQRSLPGRALCDDTMVVLLTVLTAARRRLEQL